MDTSTIENLLYAAWLLRWWIGGIAVAITVTWAIEERPRWWINLLTFIYVAGTAAENRLARTGKREHQ